MHSVDGASAIREAWGSSQFVASDANLLAPLPLSSQDRAVLTSVGLPVGPASALTLQLRFDNVEIRHRPDNIRALSDSTFERPPCYPLTGCEDVDAWARLDRFIVLGEVPNDSEPQSKWYRTDFLCLDAGSGRVSMVSATLTRGQTFCWPLNTNLVAYLASVLAYKNFRERWPELDELYGKANDSSESPEYRALARQVHAEFLAKLEAVDPLGFRDFWREHAYNEAILLEI